MKWASALIEGESLEGSIQECTRKILNDMGEGPIDLAFLFISSRFQDHYDVIVSAICDSIHPENLIGCSAGGVIGGGREVEQKPALALTVARLPGVTIQPFHLNSSDLPDLEASPKRWHACFSVEPDQKPQFIILADPFSFDAEKGLMGLDFGYPASVKVGGLVSGGGQAGENALFLNGKVHRSGMVGVSLSGNIEVDTIVAQGCRPIGEPLSVTRCDRNLLIEIDRKPPLLVLQELYERLSEEDQKKMQHALFLGLAMTPFKENLTRGDFLIRNLIGVDSKSGHLAIGAPLREGQTIQFHLRDAETSSDELQWLLTQYQVEGGLRSAKGALLFSCMGRGAHLYGEADHDSRLFKSKMGPIPLGGFFCNGEIGAVGGSTFLHGYTSCFGIFKPA